MQCPHIKQPLPTSRYAEFIGIIVDNETMLEYTHTAFGDNFGGSDQTRRDR